MEASRRCLRFPVCHDFCCESRITNPAPRLELYELDDDWDVIVIGAGPAGTSTAIHLAQKGWRVLLVERKSLPRFKVCGCCLNQQAVHQLRQLDVYEAAIQAGAVPLDRFQWASSGRTSSLPLPGGLALSREKLDSLLAERAISVGVTIAGDAAASLGTEEESGRRVELTRAGESIEITARIVIVAAGLAGRTMLPDEGPPVIVDHSYVGVGCMMRTCGDAEDLQQFEPGVIYMASGTEGYVGLTRVENHQLNLAAAINPAALRQEKADDVCRNLLKTAGIGELSLQPSVKWTGTLPLTGWRQRTSAPRVLFVGDAAGYVEPFTGEGMSWAFSAGQMAAEFIDAAEWSPRREVEWDAHYGAALRRQQTTCRFISRFLRHPQFVRYSIRILGWCPGLARPLLSRVAGRSP